MRPAQRGVTGGVDSGVAVLIFITIRYRIFPFYLVLTGTGIISIPRHGEDPTTRGRTRHQATTNSPGVTSS